MYITCIDVQLCAVMCSMLTVCCMLVDNSQVTSIMMSKADGLFSYTTLLLEQFASGDLPIILPYNAASFSSSLPQGLNDLYRQTMTRIAANIKQHKAQHQKQ